MTRPTPAMVCHRGANRIAPENTLAAARAAFDLGAAFVEIDVRTTADGELAVIHDPTVDRTTNGTGLVAHKTMAQLAALDAGSWFDPAFAGEPVPRLDAMLSLARGRGGLYVEIKAADAAAVVDMTEGAGILADCFFWSGDAAILEDLAALSEPPRLMIRARDYADLEAAIVRYRPAIVEYEAAVLSRAGVALCRRHGLQAMTLCGGDDAAEFRRLIGLGAALFNLDRPDVFQAVIAEL